MHSDQINLDETETESLREQLSANRIEKPSRKNWDILFENATDAAKTKNLKSAINGLTAALFFDSDRTFDYIRRKGIFRYYQQTDGPTILPQLATAIAQSCTQFNVMTGKRSAYLISIIALESFHTFYINIEARLLALIHAFVENHPDRSFLKTLLVYVDYLFFIDYQPEPGEETSDLSSRSVENICSAISYLIYFYTSRFTSRPRPAAEDYLPTNDIEELLLLACNYNDLREYEILVEHFGYVCRAERNIITIRPPFPGLEKSIRLGYIRSKIQSINDFIKSNPPDAASLNALTEKIINSNPPKLFEKVTDKNYPRYRMVMSEKSVDAITKAFIEPDEIFLEEAHYIGTIVKEQLLTVDELLKIPIKDNLTLFEFLKARRWFLVMSLLFSKFAESQKETDHEIIWRTLVPQLSDATLHQLLDRILAPDKVNTFLSMLSWKPTDPNVFDLQYQPLVNLNDYYEVPLYVFSNSNAVRNLYASQYKQGNTSIMKNGQIDPLVDKLRSILQNAGIEPYIGISIHNTDIDVCCSYEGTLYAFECKHSLHPVSVFDLRTMYDHILHAEHQLAIIENAFKDGSLIRVLQKNTIDCSNITGIQPCIITSNRLFNGSFFQYPVRYINELDNILLKGEVTTSTGVYTLWPEGKLTPEFMKCYFSKDDKVAAMHFDCLSPKTVRHELFGHTLEFRTFSMLMDNANAVVERFVSHLTKLREH